jgi:RNA polymerase sigma-70 factor (ECF subfamily)
MNAADAADTLQEVFRAVWVGIDSFRRERPEDTFRGWLRVIARHKIRDFFRRHSHVADAAGGTVAQQRMQEIPTLDESAEEISAEMADLYRRAMELVEGQFEEKTRLAFWLTAVDGRSPADAAAELNMSSGAIRQAKYKVLRRLRMELGDED